ncbi:MAG TPA: aspartyl protease family protein [Pyrinomonadaceae bacterium]|jgi:predicted aspartyl protease
MRRSLKTALAGVTSALLLALLTFGRAAPVNAGAARSRLGQEEAGRRTAALPAPVSFRESEGRGLLVRTWVNGAGPFTFAIDTGAGATILSQRAAAEARVQVEAGGRGIEIGGLSGARSGGAQKAFVRTIALGARENGVPARGLFVVAPGLPSDVDGILDPSEIFANVGFIIDIPAGRLSFFDPRSQGLRAGDTPRGGAVVPWLTEGGARRPFVMLAEGRRALIDTGSGFGLAVNETAARALGVLVTEGRQRRGARDLGGGEVSAKRVRAATVSIGPLVLRGIPTDLLLRAEKGAPVILGRDALRPFRLSFDPVNRLVMLDPAED